MPFPNYLINGNISASGLSTSLQDNAICGLLYPFDYVPTFSHGSILWELEWNGMVILRHGMVQYDVMSWRERAPMTLESSPHKLTTCSSDWERGRLMERGHTRVWWHVMVWHGVIPLRSGGNTLSGRVPIGDGRTVGVRTWSNEEERAPVMGMRPRMDM